MSKPARKTRDWTRVNSITWQRGPWTVQLAAPETSKPWIVSFEGRMCRRSHGIYMGYWRFLTAENAMKAVDRSLPPHWRL